MDNPPFSIFAEILRFYQEKGIKYFLFAQGVTLISSCSGKGACGIAAGCAVTYENGACVNTSFATNLEDEDIAIRTAPDLYKQVNAANEEYLRTLKKELPKYHYPDHVITSSIMNRWSKYGIEFRLKKSDAYIIDGLDSQKAAGKAIYGKGFLLSERAAAERAAAERAAAERAAAERAAAERWQLSDRELEIVKSLGESDGGS